MRLRRKDKCNETPDWRLWVKWTLENWIIYGCLEHWVAVSLKRNKFPEHGEIVTDWHEVFSCFSEIHKNNGDLSEFRAQLYCFGKSHDGLLRLCAAKQGFRFTHSVNTLVTCVFFKLVHHHFCPWCLLAYISISVSNVPLCKRCQRSTHTRQCS